MVNEAAFTFGGMIDKTWKPLTTTGIVKDDRRVGITRIELL